MSKRTPPKTTLGGDNPYDIHDAKLSRSATTHESSSMTSHEISNTLVFLDCRYYLSLFLPHEHAMYMLKYPD